MKSSNNKFKIKILNLILLNLFFLNHKPVLSQMNWNQAAGFAGNSSSYVAVPNSPSINLTGSFSIEAWVNPTTVSGSAKGIISKGSALGTSLKYGIRLTAGRITLSTNGIQRLSSKSTSLISVNRWTHIAATYNSSTSQFRIYINGNLDTSSVVAGAAPPTNTDSLFIGISGASTPFSGQIDDVRLWNKELTSAEVFEFHRSIIADTTSAYKGMVMSITFQEGDSFGSDFWAADMTGNNNNGFVRNINPVDQSNSPYSTIHTNESVSFNGSANSYLAGRDETSLDAQSSITMECWVYLTSSAPCIFISKGTTPAYQLGWNGARLSAKINNINSDIGNVSIPLFQWTHIALVYESVGASTIFVNGDAKFGGTTFAGNITNNSDSLYIGGGPGAILEMSGFIDEVRIHKNIARAEIEIFNSIYNSLDAGNDPAPSETKVSYNFDGLLIENNNKGGPRFRMNGGCRFSHPGATGNPVSPIARDEANLFSNGFYKKTVNKSIPLSGTLGTTFDTLTINENLNISDLNLFVAISHTSVSQLSIVLAAPNGDSVKIFDQLSANSADDNLAAVIDDQADSAFVNSRYTTFSPVLKSQNSLNSIFSGDNSTGKWILRIRDNVNGNTGNLYAWGLQFNNNNESRLNLNVKVLMQGFYDPSVNLLIPDTMNIYIRDKAAPYLILDSSTSILSTDGFGFFTMKNEIHDKGIHIQLKHRNSIETWSGLSINHVNYFNSYDFTDFNFRAFGNNMINVDNSPQRFALYGGDVNQDGTIDLADGSLIDNDAFNFISGYIPTDLNGDGVADLADAVFADNNAFNFISKITP